MAALEEQISNEYSRTSAVNFCARRSQISRTVVLKDAFSVSVEGISTDASIVQCSKGARCLLAVGDSSLLALHQDPASEDCARGKGAKKAAQRSQSASDAHDVRHALSCASGDQS